MPRSKASYILDFVRTSDIGEVKTVLELARDEFRKRLNGSANSSDAAKPMKRKHRKLKPAGAGEVASPAV